MSTSWCTSNGFHVVPPRIREEPPTRRRDGDGDGRLSGHLMLNDLLLICACRSFVFDYLAVSWDIICTRMWLVRQFSSSVEFVNHELICIVMVQCELHSSAWWWVGLIWVILVCVMRKWFNMSYTRLDDRKLLNVNYTHLHDDEMVQCELLSSG